MSRLFGEIEYLVEVDSTNDHLKQYVESGRPRGVRAGMQSAGKGRHGRSWYSPANVGLYVSYLVFPTWGPEQAFRLNQLCALAVGQTLLGLEPSLAERLRFKPPNDILIEERKICGILVEMATLGENIRWAILGIGINLNQRHFPDRDFRLPPTSLLLEGEGGSRSPSEVCALLTENLETGYAALEGKQALQLEELFEHIFQRPFVAAGEEI